LDSKESSKSWFCVFNNPQETYEGEPSIIAEKVLEEWVKNHPTRTGAVAYCVSAEGLIHLHMVLEDSNKARFSALKNTYPKAHLSPTKGTKEQAENYINKRGKYVEKGEQVLYIARHGEIKGNQGIRKDFDVLEELIVQGKTPREIMDMQMSYRRYEKYIKDAYFEKRNKETPFKREINVIWHVGETECGKSYTAKELAEKIGEDNFYFVSDYENGCFDKYNGEKILFLDEFRGQFKFSFFLSILHGYKAQSHARYTNIIGLWTEVHITSVLPPEKVYSRMVIENEDLDTIQQLLRRITTVSYHYKNNNEYKRFDLPINEYHGYEDLKTQSQSDENGFLPVSKLTKEEQISLPFLDTE
jgi:hypothetical protein